LFRVTNFANVSLAFGEPRVPLLAALIALGLNTASSLPAVCALGISGPALANVSPIALSTVYTLWAIRRRLGVPWSRLLPARAYLRTLAVALLSVLPASCVLLADLPAGLGVAAGAASYLVVSLCSCQATALLRGEDLAFLRGVLRSPFPGPRVREGAAS
jgi:O-antigen/teichoic acid export membrane protein